MTWNWQVSLQVSFKFDVHVEVFLLVNVQLKLADVVVHPIIESDNTNLDDIVLFVVAVLLTVHLVLFVFNVAWYAVQPKIYYLRLCLLYTV